MSVEVGKSYRIKKPLITSELPQWIEEMDPLDGQTVTVEKIRRFFSHTANEEYFCIYASTDKFNEWKVNVNWLEPNKYFVQVKGKRTPIALPFDEAKALADKVGGEVCY